MTDTSIYKDIAQRTGGSLYLGVVGPVRTGKSTFIKRFMDTLVLPNIEGDYRRGRANDEMPQSAAGRTIMTTEPKFIPEAAVKVFIDDNASFDVRLIDCVGYIVPSAIGYSEDEGPRMVMTPWFSEPIPFDKAAEIGTQKVINEHSTIGLVVTTDGSISDIPRTEYEDAEDRIISELKAINKPFIVLLNSAHPDSPETKALAAEISQKHGVSVMSVNCLELDEADIKKILAGILYEFPVKEIRVELPMWITALDDEHWFRKELAEMLQNTCCDIKKVKDIYGFVDNAEKSPGISDAKIIYIELGSGCCGTELVTDPQLFYKIIEETTGIAIKNEQELMSNIISLSESKREYMKFKDALDEVEATGYGIVMPDISELKLEDPEIVKQGGRYGVRLRASAPSIHMLKANITTEVSPIVGSEKQSEDLVMYLLNGFEEDPTKIWDSNIFGKSLHSLVNEGLHTKLARMPQDARMRLQETIERVINEGCSGLICIIL